MGVSLGHVGADLVAMDLQGLDEALRVLEAGSGVGGRVPDGKVCHLLRQRTTGKCVIMIETPKLFK